MGKIYLQNGYVDIKKILSYNMPFTFCLGGRGTGKTYGAIKWLFEELPGAFFMRRTQSEIDLINKPEFSPFQPIASDLGIDIKVRPLSKYNSAVDIMEDEEIKGNLCYTCALSTISHIRGISALDKKYLIYDEFIPEKHSRPIKNEGDAFFNAYETINRNRELLPEGEPLKVLGLANSNDIGNAIFISLGIVNQINNLIKKGREIYINKERGIAVFSLADSIISHKKADTALYKLNPDSEFNTMALKNTFSYNDDFNIRSMKIEGMKPIATIGNITIYLILASGRKYYISSHKAGNCITYGNDDYSLNRFKAKFGMRMLSAYLDGRMFFESQAEKVIFENIF